MKAITCILLCLGLATAAGAHSETPVSHQYLKHDASSDFPFSDAVLAGDTLYLSGAGGFDPETGQLPEGAADEARQLMENIVKTLALADMTTDNLVSVTIYCPDLTLYGEFNRVYRSYFNGDLPARAFIGSGPLLFGMRFEMKAIAKR